MIRDQKLILYYENDFILELIENESRKNNIELAVFHLPLSELPIYKHAGHFLDSCKAMNLAKTDRPSKFKGEKGIIHYWRDFVDAGEDVYKQLVSVWMSKVPLIAGHAAVQNPFSTQSFAWIDASIARFNGARTNWDFSKAQTQKGAMLHYSNRMKMHGRKLPLNASFMLAEKDIWNEINAIFIKTIEEELNSVYAHDEETILGLCHKKRPDLFCKLGDPIRNRPQTYMQKSKRFFTKIFAHG